VEISSSFSVNSPVILILYLPNLIYIPSISIDVKLAVWCVRLSESLVWMKFLVSNGAPSFCSHCMEYNLNVSPNFYFKFELHPSQHEAINSNPAIKISYLLKHRHIHL
jgi:hypothetical protein